MEDAPDQQKANIALPLVKIGSKEHRASSAELVLSAKDVLLPGASLQEITDEKPRSLHFQTA